MAQPPQAPKYRQNGVDPLRAGVLDARQMPAVGMAGHRFGLDGLAAQRVRHEQAFAAGKDDAVAAMADMIDDAGVQPRRAPMKNSILPSPPAIEDGNTSISRAAERGGEGRDVVADFLMHRRVADDAALGMLSRRLELRLDQRQQMHRRRRQRQRHRQHGFQRNEADIDHDDVGPLRQPLALEAADIGLFHRNDPGMAVQRGMQLAAPDIDRKHQAGAVGEQHLGEAAGRGADVEADVVLDLDRDIAPARPPA